MMPVMRGLLLRGRVRLRGRPDLRAPEVVGIQFAHAPQVNRRSDFYTSNDEARIETDGRHIGLSLRFQALQRAIAAADRDTRMA